MRTGNSLSWRGAALHLENFLPGVILAAELLALGVLPPRFTTALEGNAVISSLVFIAGSYGIGLVSAIVSRAVVDFLSEIGPRGWIFELFAHADRAEVVERLREDDAFRRDLEFERARRRSKVAADWNAIYRYALRANQSDEVKRRRAQGRLVRGLLFPAALGVVVLLDNWNASTSLYTMLSVGEFVFAAATMVFVYSYAELMNMAEAWDITAEVRKAARSAPKAKRAPSEPAG